MAKNASVGNPRTYFTQSDDVLDPPNLVDHQSKSFQWFIDEGLGELLAEISPIDDYTGPKTKYSV
jgi:DNA-directed RNA polymerase subunit beta